MAGITGFDVIQKIYNNYMITRRNDVADEINQKFEYHLVRYNEETHEITILERLGSSGKKAASIPETQISLAKTALLNYLPE